MKKSCLESISESQVQIDRIHIECNRIKVFLEDIIQPPCHVGVYGEVFECFPFTDELHTPLEFP